MAMRRPVVLALASMSLTACFLDGSARSTVVSFNIEGRERFLTAPAAEETRLAALADQASRDLGCLASAVRASRRSEHVYAVEACGKQGVYLAVTRQGMTEAAPGFEGTRVWLHMTRFVPISTGDGDRVLESLSLSAAPSITSTRWYYEVPAQGSANDAAEARTALRPWILLNEQGARDLSCPRGATVVELRRIGRDATPIAEGCGKRAVYLPARGRPPVFDLASIVPVNRP